MDKVIYYNGLSVGGALAMILSWNINASIGWAFLHGLCSWFYVIYYYFTYYK
jgi:hypothetical protein